MHGMSRLFWSQFLLLLVAGSAQASQGLFAENEVLKVELRGPLAATIGDKRNPVERPFAVVVDGDEWPVAVRTRGKSRLKLCRFPPLRFNFRDSAIEEGPFARVGKVKVVTHCENRPANDDNVLEEYLAYRLFNLFTERSHRVRLLRIRYVDTEKPKRAPVEKYAFAIEPLDDLAARTGAEVAAVEHLARRRIDLEQAALAFVFQYLISNLDWSLVKAYGDSECCHNMKVLEADGAQFVVPYDFDMSGLVYPKYVLRAPNTSSRMSRSRKYAGYCFDGLDLEGAIATVVASEAEIMALVDSLDWSEERAIKERHKFFQKFFAEAREAGLAERMQRSCIG